MAVITSKNGGVDDGMNWTVSAPKLTGKLRWVSPTEGSRHGMFLQQEWVGNGGCGNYYWVDVPEITTSALAKQEADKVAALKLGALERTLDNLLYNAGPLASTGGAARDMIRDDIMALVKAHMTPKETP